MTQHVLIGDLGPALMIAAVRGPLLVFFLPAAVLAPLARNSRVRAVLGTLLRPRVAFTLWAANLAIWHIPYVYDLALAHQNLHNFEHVCWVFCGMLVWTLLIDPGSHRRLTVGGRVALAASMFAAGMILSDVLIFTLHAALSVLPRCRRDLGAPRPAARRDRDDRRAAPHARDLRRAAAAAALEPRSNAPPGRFADVTATSFSFEPLFLDPRGRRRRVLLARGAHRPPRDVARRRLRVRALPDRGLAQLAARDDRGAVPPAHPPAAERAHRRRGAAARRARPDAADAEGGRPPRPRSAADALDPSALARRVVPHPPRAVLQLGAAHRLGAEHRARDPDRGRPPLLVADRERAALAAGGARVPRARVHRLLVPRPRRSSSPAGRSTRSTSTRRGSGACRRSATRTSAGS